jgi:nucleoside-diphosphate-sugar epimerase
VDRLGREVYKPLERGLRGRFLFLGYGYAARALAPLLAQDGWTLAASARSPEQAQALARGGLTPRLWTAPGLDPVAVDEADAILVSTPPDKSGCPAFAAAAAAIARRARFLRWVGYLSSTGVYGDHGGATVDEDSELRARSERGRDRIVAEVEWAGHGVEWAYPLIVFRLAGLYGPGRSAIDAARAGRAERIVKAGQVFNRIEIGDAAQALKASLDHPGAGDLFNLADDEPAPPQDVVAFACMLLGVDPPPETPFERARLSAAAADFYADNKRVSNVRMKARLKVALRHPTYREGLRAIASAQSPTV